MLASDGDVFIGSLRKDQECV